MNREEYIPHSEAMLLKSIGFNEPCSYYYDFNGDFCTYFDDIIGESIPDDNKNNSYLNTIDFGEFESDLDICTTITYHTATNWLYKVSGGNIYFDISPSNTIDTLNKYLRENLLLAQEWKHKGLLNL